MFTVDDSVCEQFLWQPVTRGGAVLVDAIFGGSGIHKDNELELTLTFGTMAIVNIRHFLAAVENLW